MTRRRAVAASGTMLALILLAGCVSINFPPVARFDANPSAGWAPLTVSFDASASSDSDGAILAYTWEFGDGEDGTGQFTSHTYDVPGAYAVELHVTDDGGLTSTETKQIVVRQPNVEIVEWTLETGPFGARVDGTAQNVSSVALAAAEIVVIFRDDGGEEIERGRDTEQDIQPGEMWGFSVSALTLGADIDSASVFVGDVIPE